MIEWLGWTDVLDILITFFIFYGTYLSIRGTRALQLILGIGTLVFFMVFVYVFQLSTLEFLFRNVWEIGLILLILVFQPEIRQALTNLGQNRIFALFGELQSENLINALLKSSESLSKREVGALVAVEKEVGLKTYIKTGSDLGADVTPELLQTIFMSKGPLHDGGLIIQDNKVAAAGCIFPLSDRSDLPSHFGTRHRAAVGMAQESDAFVLVISEETGQITTVHGSQFDTDIDLETLEDHLYMHLTE